MSYPICTACNQACDVISLDVGMHDQNNNVNLGARETHLSFCCKAPYAMLSIAEQIQRETLAETIIKYASGITQATAAFVILALAAGF